MKPEELIKTERSPLEWMTTRLTSLAGAIAVVYAYAYILGYAYLTFFFSRLNAPWAVDLFDVTAVAQTPAIVASTAACLLSGFALNSRRVPVPTITAPLVIGGAGAVTYLIHLSVKKWMQAYDSYWTFGTFVCGITAAIMVAIIIYDNLVKSKGRRQGSWFFLTGLAAFALFATPFTANIRTGKIKDSKATALPAVSLSEEVNETWRLLKAIDGGKMILIRHNDEESFDFRVIDSNEVRAISVKRAK